VVACRTLHYASLTLKQHANLVYAQPILSFAWYYIISKMPSFSSEDQAIRTVCAKHFHQALWLPGTAAHSKLRVTYSTTTNFDNVSLPVILFIGPMFGTRWLLLNFDKLAKDCGVRVICVDRYARNRTQC
jgi:hypothetical protein